jgi:hypothetical protein
VRLEALQRASTAACMNSKRAGVVVGANLVDEVTQLFGLPCAHVAAVPVGICARDDVHVQQVRNERPPPTGRRGSLHEQSEKTFVEWEGGGCPSKLCVLCPGGQRTNMKRLFKQITRHRVDERAVLDLSIPRARGPSLLLPPFPLDATYNLFL